MKENTSQLSRSNLILSWLLGYCIGIGGTAAVALLLAAANIAETQQITANAAALFAVTATIAIIAGLLAAAMRLLFGKHK